MADALAADAAVAAAIGKRAPKTTKGRRIVKRREPQAVETAKTALLMAGNRISYQMQMLMRDLHRIRSPLSALFSRKHDLHPFEDVQRVEALCQNYGHGLFVFGSSSKKRPSRLIFGRLFNGYLLDMQEFGVTEYKPMQSFGAETCILGGKPLLLFQGPLFDSDERMKQAKSLLLDYFSGPRPEKVMLAGLDQVIVCSAFDGEGGASSSSPPRIGIRRFKINLAKATTGSRLPHVELKETGPSFMMDLDRSKAPDREKWKQAIKVPKELKPKKVKNVSKDAMGKRSAKVHLGRQDFDQIHTVHHGKAKRRKLNEDVAGGAPAPDIP